MNPVVLSLTAIFAFLFGGAALIMVLTVILKSKDKVSLKSLKAMMVAEKEEILTAMITSLEETQETINNCLPNLEGFETNLLAKVNANITKAVADEKTARGNSENDLTKQLTTKIDADVNGVKRLVEEVKKDLYGKIEALNGTATRLEKAVEELKVVIKDGDQKAYNALANLLDERTKQEEQKLDEIKKGLEDFKQFTFQKSEDLRKAMGNLYPVEILAEKLGIPMDIAQKLLDAGYDSVEKIAQTEAVLIIVSLQGIVDAKDILSIHTKAKEIVSIQETVEEIKSQAKVVEEETKKDATVEEKK